MIVGLDHIQIAAPPGAESAARRFYSGLLGLPELAKPASLVGRGGVWFECGDHQVHIGIERDFRPSKKGHPAFSVANLDQLREQLAAAGCVVDADEALPGSRRFYSFDPFGNRLEFLEPLPAGETPDPPTQVQS